MAGASSDSLAAARQALEPTLASGGLQLARELFSTLNVLDENGPLRRALTDPSWTVERRSGVLRSLFGGRLSDDALQVLTDLAGRRWSRERDFGDAVEQLAVTAVAASAEREGLSGLDRLSQELLSFQHVVEESHEVQRALTDQQAPAEARGNLAERLTGNGSQEVRLLVRQAVQNPRGLKPAELIRRFATAVAGRQRQWIADVTVARPLSDEQQARLAEGLRRSFGRDLKLDVTVDPALVGGVRVKVGDDVVDSTVATRLHDLQRKMAG